MSYFSRLSGDDVSSGNYFDTNRAILGIRRGVSSGWLEYTTVVVSEKERLDHIAHRFYGDGRMWWVIAAATGIGWWPQVTPGTTVRVPTNIEQIENIV